MSREETKKIIMAMTVYYPNFKPSCDLGIMVDLWTDAFSDVAYEKVYTALKTYAKTDTSGFAPSIGALNNLICTIEERSSGEELNEMEAWALVSRALRNGLYASQEEYNRLPTLVQKAVGSPQNLHNWATTDYETIDTVIMSNFQRTYRSVLSQTKENRRMPLEVRTMIETKSVNPMLIEKGDYE